MEFEKKKKKVPSKPIQQGGVSTYRPILPRPVATYYMPILKRRGPRPILPKPVPTYTSVEKRHLGCFESSTGGAEISRNLHGLSAQGAYSAAPAGPHMSLDNNTFSFSQLLAQAEADAQFNKTAFLGHHHHLSRQQQPFFNVIHDNYKDPHCGKSNKFRFCFMDIGSSI